ncbi:MAG: hypothetical protein U0401_07650 [Anaerolineae bacterium]
MVPSERDIVMHQEQYRDLLREAEQERLIRMVRSQQPTLRPLSDQFLRWIGLAILRIGAEMVKWGLKLQRCNLTTPGEIRDILGLNEL